MNPSLILALLSCACGAFGAYYWLHSARVKAIPVWASANDDPDFLSDVPMNDLLGRNGWISCAINSLAESARWNKIAALWSAGAVAFTALSSIAAALGH